jgi:two-component system sensor histidine kinase/response regulator
MDHDRDHWRRLVERIPYWIWTATPAGDVDYCNPWGLEYTGLSADAVRAGALRGAIHPDDRSETRRAWGVATANGTEHVVEVRLRRHDGAYRWFLWRGTPMRDEGGALVEWVGVATDITDHKLLEDDAHQRERLYGMALEIGQMSVWSWELHGAQVEDAVLSRSMIPESHALMGVPPDVISSLGWSETLARCGMDLEARERVTSAVQSCVDGETSEFTVEVQIERPGGTHWRLIRGMPVRDAAGVTTGFGGTAMDVTARRQAEESMRLVTDRLARAAELSQLSVWEFEVGKSGLIRDGTLVVDRVMYSTVNRLMTPLAAVTFSECLTRVGVLRDDQLVFEKAIQDCLDGKTDDYEFEFRGARSDGVFCWRTARGNISMRAPDGRPIRVAGAAIDITGRKFAERDRARIQERLEVAIRGSNLGIWDFDLPDGLLETGDKAFFNVWEPLGYAPDEVPADIEDDLTFAAHPADRSRIREAVETFLAGTERQFEAEFRARAKDGSVRWRLARGLATRNVAGSATRFIGTLVDITDIKRIETELQQARKQAEAANRAKDDFLANVSHEVRTPMNAILGMTELTLDSPLSEHQQMLLKTVKLAANNLLVIINDLLDFSKIEAGKLELEAVDFSLRAVVGETVRALAARAHRKGLELMSNVQPDVPDAVVGDAGRLRQVLLNIVGNAIKFTEQGEISVQVARDLLQAATDDAVPVRISVRDTGIGIASASRERIFRAFEQADTSTTRRYGGTGLGLSIASNIVGLMGGDIMVESELGGGSVFLVTARLALQRAPIRPAPSPPAFVRDARVLVVDDNATHRGILEQWLAGWQMRPTAVGDGVAAMGALWDAGGSDAPYELVLLDAHMPDTDGWELAARIRARTSLSGVHIVVLASVDRPGDPARSRELRIDAHLLKPLLQEELLETIQRVLSKTDGEPLAVAIESDTPRKRMEPHAGSLNVLVAEDNEFSSSFMEELLAGRGHKVAIATNGHAALTMAGEGGYDLLLLDLHMPQLDGFEVARAIRQREQRDGGHLPMIALTARSRKEDRDRCMAAGMDGYLAKPVGPADLFATVERLLAAQSALDPLLDPAAILGACQENDAMLAALLRDLRTLLPARLAAMRAAIRSAHDARIREAARELRAMLLVLSQPAARIATDAERLAAEERFDQVEPLLDQLEEMGERIVRLSTGVTIARLRHQTASSRAESN